MSKSDVLAKGCWDVYPFKIEMLAVKPKNYGVIDENYAKELDGKLFSFEYGSLESGSFVKFYWVLDKDQKVIAARYKAFGSAVLIATCDIVALLSRNKTLEEIEKLNYKSVEYFLRDHPSNPALPLAKRYEIFFCIEALEYGVNRLKNKEQKDSKIVCKCRQVSKETIIRAIKEFDIVSIEEIAGYTGAGAFCSKCISPTPNHTQDEYLIDILKATRKEIEEAKSKDKFDSSKPFKQMNLEEKKMAIEKVIDEYIRSMLVMDGGDMEIIDLKENGKHTDLYIRYLGACSGCASASTGTLFAIEGILKQKLDPDIRVLPI
jgi:NifU-like protein